MSWEGFCKHLLAGVGSFLKEKNPNIRIFALEPEESPYLSTGKAGKHGIEGIGAGKLSPNLANQANKTPKDIRAYRKACRFWRRSVASTPKLIGLFGKTSKLLQLLSPYLNFSA